MRYILIKTSEEQKEKVKMAETLNRDKLLKLEALKN